MLEGIIGDEELVEYAYKRFTSREFIALLLSTIAIRIRGSEGKLRPYIPDLEVYGSLIDNYGESKLELHLKDLAYLATKLSPIGVVAAISYSASVFPRAVKSLDPIVVTVFPNVTFKNNELTIQIVGSTSLEEGLREVTGIGISIYVDGILKASGRGEVTLSLNREFNTVYVKLFVKEDQNIKFIPYMPLNVIIYSPTITRAQTVGVKVDPTTRYPGTTMDIKATIENTSMLTRSSWIRCTLVSQSRKYINLSPKETEVLRSNEGNMITLLI